MSPPPRREGCTLGPAAGSTAGREEITTKKSARAEAATAEEIVTDLKRNVPRGPQNAKKCGRAFLYAPVMISCSCVFVLLPTAKKKHHVSRPQKNGHHVSTPTNAHQFSIGCTLLSTDGFLRILCNGLCTAQRFHTEGEEQTCRLGCPNEPDSLPHYNECPLLYNLFAPIWVHASALPRRGHLLHDLIPQIFLRSLQCGIVVMGLIDNFCLWFIITNAEILRILET